MNSEFHDYIIYDVLGHIPHIASRKMFGGYGIYHEGIIFGLILDDELYFKVADHNRPDYEVRGSEPFTYTGHKNRKPTVMQYWKVPEEIMEDPEMVEEWMWQAKKAHKK
ncbi:TfoX/Sxy family protein [Candidatus Nomurabacteria bacterium]|nr:TfoX/Sxy family protein [Candidatus Nomurabacteria bacterium]